MSNDNLNNEELVNSLFELKDVDKIPTIYEMLNLYKKEIEWSEDISLTVESIQYFHDKYKGKELCLFLNKDGLEKLYQSYKPVDFSSKITFDTKYTFVATGRLGRLFDTFYIYTDVAVESGPLFKKPIQLRYKE